MNTTTLKSTRNVNIDLLRSLLMLGIIMMHTCSHGLGFTALYTDSYTVDRYTTMEAYLVSFFAVSVNVFFLISGFYHPNGKPRKLFDLWLMVVTYSVAVYLVLCYVGIQEFSTAVLLQRLLTGFTDYWFFSVYAIIYAFSRYINRFYESLSDRELIHWLILFAVINVLFGFILTDQSYGSAFSVLPMFFVYSLGYAIARFQLPEKIHRFFFGSLLCGIVYVLISIVTALWGLSTLAANKQALAFRIFTSYCGPLILIASAALFLTFASAPSPIRGWPARVISKIGSAAFAAYLITDSSIIRSVIFQPIRELSALDVSPKTLLLAIAKQSLLLFAGCVVIELIRSTIYYLLFPRKKS